MAKKRAGRPKPPPPPTLRLFFHPQRGAVIFKGEVPPGHERWRGGRDTDWRDLGRIELADGEGGTRLAPGARLPAGFLPGDPSRQYYGFGGPELVFGPLEKVCRDCGDPFVLTAREQKHHAEDLGLFTEVTSVRCAPCRRKKGKLARAKAEYVAALRAAEAASTAETNLAVARAALALLDAGGHAPLDKAIAFSRRARRLGAAASADRVEEALLQRRAARAAAGTRGR